MCISQPSKSSNSSKTSTRNASVKPPFKWSSVYIPIIAGLLHLYVFYQACSFLNLGFESFADKATPTTGRDIYNQNKEFFHGLYLLERAVFMSYTFDLVCCYIFKIIPFSRMNSPTDIAAHHLPILLLVLPLGIPVWAELTWAEPLLHSVLSHDKEGEAQYRLDAIDNYRRIIGWGFFSSLNEFIMCFQRAEMNLHGIDSFRSISQIHKNKRFFTGRLIIGIELYFKLCIFYLFSLFAFKASSDTDSLWYTFYVDVISSSPPPSSLLVSAGSGATSFWSAAKIICRSPTAIRTIIFRLFMLSMYPFLGWLSIKKIIEFHSGVRMRLEKKKERNLMLTASVVWLALFVVSFSF